MNTKQQQRRKLNEYETVYLIKPDLNEIEFLNLAQYLQQLLINNKAQNVLSKSKGKIKLSYSINNYYEATFIETSFLGNGKVIEVFEKYLKENENILRYISFKKKFIYKE
jgi:small subunit ribosomal protein S6|uniref:30S ribosomal protein S6, chloroplastic n=1 Tax=Galdieria yellowstonensis TaxID=3028027 RepID=A0A9Y1I2W2_9RHOD|nr:ribosomal protein S6 [Galdieria yellowstonensis]